LPIIIPFSPPHPGAGMPKVERRRRQQGEELDNRRRATDTIPGWLLGRGSEAHATTAARGLFHLFILSSRNRDLDVSSNIGQVIFGMCHGAQHRATDSGRKWAHFCPARSHLLTHDFLFFTNTGSLLCTAGNKEWLDYSRASLLTVH